MSIRVPLDTTVRNEAGRLVSGLPLFALTRGDPHRADSVMDGLTTQAEKDAAGAAFAATQTEIDVYDSPSAGVPLTQPLESYSEDSAFYWVAPASVDKYVPRDEKNPITPVECASAVLSASAMEYQGSWNASTNTPTLADGTGSAGDVYRVSTGAARNLGSGSITFTAGDYVIYNGTTWEVDDNSPIASQIANTPAGQIAATNVQAAINELDTEKAKAGIYIPQYTAAGRFTVAAANPTIYLVGYGQTELSAVNCTAVGAASLPTYRLFAANVGANSALRLRASVRCANLAPAQNFTFSLYSLTIAVTVITPTIVAGSSFVVSTATANTFAENTLDIALPADGRYAMGYVVAGTPANGGTVEVGISALLAAS